MTPRTLNTYRHSLAAWITPTLGNTALRDVGPTDVRRWHQFVLSRTGPTAARQAHALLRAIFSTAVADDLVPRNPCRIRGAGQPNSPERPLVDVDVVMALTNAMPEHLQTLTLVAFWGHSRLGELLGLRVDDVDLRTGTLRIERQVVEVDGEGPPSQPPRSAAGARCISQRLPSKLSRATSLISTTLVSTRHSSRGRAEGSYVHIMSTLPGTPPGGRSDSRSCTSMTSARWPHPVSTSRRDARRGDAPSRPRVQPGRDALPARCRRTRRRDCPPHVRPRPAHVTNKAATRLAQEAVGGRH